MRVLWSKNGNYSHNDTGCPDTTGNSSRIIKGDFSLCDTQPEIVAVKKELISSAILKISSF